jgi:hypothetical protein
MPDFLHIQEDVRHGFIFAPMVSDKNSLALSADSLLFSPMHRTEGQIPKQPEHYESNSL